MAPKINNDSLVLVKTTPIEKIKNGEIVAFYDPKNFRRIIIHRIINKIASDSNIYFITKGDSNSINDTRKIIREAVIGRVFLVIPYLGQILKNLHKPVLTIIFIALPGLIITIHELRKFNKFLRAFHKRKPALKKYRKRSSIKFVEFTLLYPIIIGFFILNYNFKPAYTLFASQTESVRTVKSGDWEQPSSTITSLSGFQNNTQFSISYTSKDTYSFVGTISLYYRFNNGNWNLFQTKDLDQNIQSYTGSFSFNSPDGEGRYDFFITSADTFQNIEHDTNKNKILEPEEYPLPQTSTLIDTTPPTATLAVTNSWEKTVEEKITSNAGFELGSLDGWIAVGNTEAITQDAVNNPQATVAPYEGNFMVRIGNKEDPGNWAWENRIMRSIASGSKSLSLYYNFHSRDLSSFDNPGFFIRLNGQEILKLDPSVVNTQDASDGQARTTGWRHFYYDLSNVDNNINLSFYAGNTGDKNNQSWVYIDSLTTYFVAAPANAGYTLVGNDLISGISHLEYKFYKENDPEPENWQLYTGVFHISEGGTYNLKYRAVDKAQNSTVYLVKIITDTEAPAKITDLRIENGDITVNSATLSWSPTGNDGATGKASQYNLRYQKNCHTSSDFNFDTAVKADRPPSPQEAGQGKTETFEILGLNPDTDYCFGLKTGDEAPNWSEISNVVVEKTLSGLSINPGDIVINEIMWMGSSVSPQDQWLELKNMTDRILDITGFTLTKFDGTSESIVDIDFTGQSLPAYGFFLIAKNNDFNGIDSQLNTIPNLWDNDLDLSYDTLQIKLYAPSNILIDTAWDGSWPTEGFLDNTLKKYYSMERISIPGDGTNPLSWYTSIDETSIHDFFDGDADERGTPGAVNRSENEPLAHMLVLRRSFEAILPTITPTPQLESVELLMVLSEDRRYISFSLSKISSIKHLSYALSYDSDFGSQGIVGEVDLVEQEKYEKNNLLLGTCSTGGTCIYHTGVKNVKLQVTLQNLEDETQVLEQTL